MPLKLNDMENKAKDMCAMIRAYLGDKVNNFCIEETVENKYEKEFRISFEAYNYYYLYFCYSNGRMGFSIVYGQYGIGLSLSQEIWETADFDALYSKKSSKKTYN